MANRLKARLCSFISGLALLCFFTDGTWASSAPQVTSVDNAASFTAAIAPGGLISIFGANLAAGPEAAQRLPLPTELNGVRISINGSALPLLYVSSGQINAQLPFNVTGGQTLSVNTANGSGQIPIAISDVAPAIFSIDNAQGSQPAITHTDGTLVSSSSPAQAGEFISIYMTGLGQVSGQTTAGQPAPSSPPLAVTVGTQVNLGTGAPLVPSFAGLSPGYAGLYLVNVQLPSLNPGTYMLSVVAGNNASNTVSLPVSAATAVQHYEYVLTSGNIYAYDMDHGFSLVKHITLPQAQAIRGVTASPSTHILYISHGGDGGVVGNGGLLAYNLLNDTVMWSVDYQAGIDSMAITPDGKTIYMPTGEASLGSTWNVINAQNGAIVGTINADTSPHNTIVGLDGSKVYMGPRNANFLVVASTATNTVSQRIGPLIGGVRPFTINGKQTLAFTTATGFLGFQVSDINTGQVLYTVPIAGFSVPPGFTPSTPSHGISLSPDEKELWVMDAANSYVHVFDVSGLPASGPRQIANVPLTRPMTGIDTPCVYDCTRDGWIQHSRDGRYVFIGDSGDVFDTKTRQVVTNLDPLYNTRMHLEIDWQNGVPISTTTRYGLGYVTR